MASDYELRVHRDWIGLLQPVGLVVSPQALLAAQAFPDKNILNQQQALLSLITPPAPKDGEKTAPKRPPLPLDFEALATEVLGWKPNKLAGSPNGPALSEKLELVLPEFGETLRPTYAVPSLKDDDAEWMMLIQELPDGALLDEPPTEETKKWHASPQVRLERLLRETGVPIGILANGQSIRLVYAPRRESSGHVTWPVYALGEVAGRPLLSALCMLLGSARLFTLPRDQRLPHILKESRKYQNVVSTKLAGQVLEALNELLRGFQSANEVAKGGLLDATVRNDPDHVYGGLLAVLLRLVFILYAEERGLLSSSAVYVRNYSLLALFDKLRIDTGRFPDTMDQRYGAWSRLLVLFRMIHDGAKRGDLRLPPRYGHLFDPDGWAFLEGRGVNRVMGAPVEVPKVPDGVLLRILEKLLLLDGDRLSYRALDVEQIGSVYENMMGFRLERAFETSIGAGKEHVVIGLETLLAKKDGEREKHLKETTGVELSGKAAEALNQAVSIDDVVASLSRRLSPLTPRTVPAGGIYLQPTDERRRSGSHYTPRELTDPIVRTTLRPIFEDLGATPKPEQILALKICDPAMGSGAFLVEACRQIADQLVQAYDVHGRPTDVPPDEDILLYAQRQVAQHCLYGVDKNPFAVDLGKLSLWLATLARDHPFTFLDYSIRHGDSLVGLSREQIASFNWKIEHGLKQQIPMLRSSVDKAITEAVALRQKIQDLANSDDVREKRRLLHDADYALAKIRLVGDCIVACFFSEEKQKARGEARKHWETEVQGWLSGSDSANELTGFVEDLRSGGHPVQCFHWEIEFPEVFTRERHGFDAVLGNPPFLAGSRISSAFGRAYLVWLLSMYSGSHGNGDLSAFFFRRGFQLLRESGTFGLIATKTIAQGDSRTTGLRWIRENGGWIYSARRRYRWPGLASVTVSVVHARRTPARLPSCALDGKPVGLITAFLFERGPDADPAALKGQDELYFSGSKVNGLGFFFSPSERESWLHADPDAANVLMPFLDGDDLKSSPTLSASRYVICFGEASFEQASRWPLLLDHLSRTVRVQRATNNRPRVREYWWQFEHYRRELYDAMRPLKRVIVCSFVGAHTTFAFCNTKQIFSHNLGVFLFEGPEFLALMQSRVHEVFASALSSTLEDRQGYRPTDCFDSFPFPPNLERLRGCGEQYNTFRTQLMITRSVGLTDLYNSFHDPDETDPDILKLRELHAVTDHVVLDAYGWSDIQPTCDFLLDFEEEDDDVESTGGRCKKKPWRYRWPDDLRDEVLARLLELNAKRAKEQTSRPPSGSPTTTSGGIGAKLRGRANATKNTLAQSQGSLFGGEEK